MIKFLDAVVADCTVGAAGRPPVVACGAPLGLHHKPIDLVLLEARPSPAIPHSMRHPSAGFLACCVTCRHQWPSPSMRKLITGMPGGTRCIVGKHTCGGAVHTGSGKSSAELILMAAVNQALAAQRKAHMQKVTCRRPGASWPRT